MIRTPTADEIDGALVRRAQGGDRAALRDLVTGAYPLVRRWALVRTGDPTEADDLTQDVLVQVIQKLGGFRGEGRFTTWLYTVVRRAAADRFREAERRARLEQHPQARLHPVDGEVESPAREAVAGEVRDVVRAFFHHLPPRQREVFDLVELQGLPATEVARRLDIEPVSVRAHLFKARRTLRAWILEHHPTLAPEGTHEM